VRWTWQQNVTDKQGEMTYQSFVDGLLCKNEHFLTPISVHTQGVAFDSAQIAAVTDEASFKQNHSFKSGIVVLTDKRMILLSASAWVFNEVSVVAARSQVPPPPPPLPASLPFLSESHTILDWSVLRPPPDDPKKCALPVPQPSALSSLSVEGSLTLVDSHRRPN
jgi:hypothetical protein